MNINLLTRADSQPRNCLMVGAVLMLTHVPGVQAQTLTFEFTQEFGADTRVLEGRFQGNPARAGDISVFDDPMDLDSFSVTFSCAPATFFDTACNTSFNTTYNSTAVASAPSSLFEDPDSTQPFQFFFDPTDSSSLDFKTNFFDDPNDFADCPGSTLLCQVEINNPDSAAAFSGRVSQTQVLNNGTTTSFINSSEVVIVSQTQNSPEIPEGKTIWGTLLSIILGLFFAKYTAKKSRTNSRIW